MTFHLSRSPYQLYTGTSGNPQRSSPVNFMLLAVGKVHEHREMTSSIKPEVEFHRTLGLSIGCPENNGQAQLDGCCIQEIDLAFELELMRWNSFLASLQNLEERLL